MACLGKGVRARPLKSGIQMPPDAHVTHGSTRTLVDPPPPLCASRGGAIGPAKPKLAPLQRKPSAEKGNRTLLSFLKTIGRSAVRTLRSGQEARRDAGDLLLLALRRVPPGGGTQRHRQPDSHERSGSDSRGPRGGSTSRIGGTEPRRQFERVCRDVPSRRSSSGRSGTFLLQTVGTSDASGTSRGAWHVVAGLPHMSSPRCGERGVHVSRRCAVSADARLRIRGLTRRIVGCSKWGAVAGVGTAWLTA